MRSGPRFQSRGAKLGQRLLLTRARAVPGTEKDMDGSRLEKVQGRRSPLGHWPRAAAATGLSQPETQLPTL